MKHYRAFFHVPIAHPPLSSSLMKYITLPFPSSTLLVLYRKVNNPQIYTPSIPTPINTFLSSRCHPPHVTKSISYSQALRFRRICSDDKSLKKRLGEMSKPSTTIGKSHSCGHKHCKCCRHM